MGTIVKQYITNNKGRKTAVVIAIDDFEKLMEDLHDLAKIAERKKEPVLKLEDVKANYKKK